MYFEFGLGMMAVVELNYFKGRLSGEYVIEFLDRRVEEMKLFVIHCIMRFFSNNE